MPNESPTKPRSPYLSPSRLKSITANRRRWLAIAPIAVWLLLSACTPDTSDDPEAAEGSATDSQQDSGADGAQGTGTLRIGMALDSDQPLLNQRTGINMCETLVRVTEDFELEPSLATDWEYQGENTFRFNLREDVTFHDGTPLTAEAVRHSLEQVVEEGLYNSTGLGADSVAIVDEHTVDITPAEPNRRLVEQLGHPGTSIVHPDSNPREKPICTGPFEFVEYVPDERLEVTRYDDYWGPPAKADRLIVSVIPDETTRSLALRSGDVDVIKDVPPEDIEELASEGFKIAKSGIGATLAMPMNIEREDSVLHDVQVRRALALSLDRQALVEGPLANVGQFTQVLGSPGVLGSSSDDVEGFTYNLERAKELLEDAGWEQGEDGIRTKDGEPLAVRLVPFPTVHREAMELVQAHARRAGFDVTIDFAPDPGTFYDGLEQGDWDLLSYPTNQGDASPVQKSQAYVTGESFGKWSQPGGRYDELVSEADATPDLNESQSKAAESQKLLIEEHVAIVPLAGLSRVWGTDPGVSGFTPHPNWLYQEWHKVEPEKE